MKPKGIFHIQFKLSSIINICVVIHQCFKQLYSSNTIKVLTEELMYTTVQKFLKKLILLFSKDALTLSKDFYIIIRNSNLQTSCSFELSIDQRILKKL